MKLRQYIPALALMLAILGMLITPGITSAWLVCDPCCPKEKSIQAESTGREIAISYANAGTHFFQGLIALENSNTTAAKKAFDNFAMSVRNMRTTLGNSPGEMNLKEKISIMMTNGKLFYRQIQERRLPDISQITQLGRQWAQLQGMANVLVISECK